MDELPDGSVDMCMTSPPYWGLRDYGDDVREIWGGDPDCEHKWNREIKKWHSYRGNGPCKEIYDDSFQWKGSNHAFCQKCNAWYGQLGLEPTFELYLEHLLFVCSEIKRVLKKTGSFWLNMGDTYTGSWGSESKKRSTSPLGLNKRTIKSQPRSSPQARIKMQRKCLLGIPWRLVLRLVDEERWILRNAVCWAKPNAMPSSVKDRLSNNHEYLFHLVKNTKPQYYWNEKTWAMVDKKPPKNKQREGIDWHWVETDHKLKKRTYWHSLGYWYDLDAIREPHKDIRDYLRHAPFNYRVREAKKGHFGIVGVQSRDHEMERYDRKGIRIPGQTAQGMHRKGHSGYHSREGKLLVNPRGKNPGDVWTISTQPFPQAHFATFPDALCIRPILATCPAEICKKCGKARVRITDKNYTPTRPGRNTGTAKSGTDLDPNQSLHQRDISKYRMKIDYQTIGWTDCGCNAGWDSGVLLDPFAGRGTALIMAKKLGRHFIGYELKKEYCEKLIKPALEEIDPLFNWKTPSPLAG